MQVDVKITEGGALIGQERMKLSLVKEFSNDIILYENEDGKAVLYFKEKDEYILVSIDMA